MAYIASELEKELIHLLVDCKVERLRTVQIMVALKTEENHQILMDWILKQKTLPTQKQIIAKTEKIIAKNRDS